MNDSDVRDIWENIKKLDDDDCRNFLITLLKRVLKTNPKLAKEYIKAIREFAERKQEKMR